MSAQATPIAVLSIEEVERIAQKAYAAGRLDGQPPERMLNVKEVAKLLGVSTGTVYSLASNGEIPCRKAGDRYIFNPHTIADWVAGTDVK